jgi:hypothetical protein
MTPTTRAFQKLYERDLHLLANPICRDCDARVRHPLLPWLVGRRFFETSERLVFVGKPHRGIPGEILPSGIVDPRHSVQPGLWNSKWPYWRYTREIAENLYGENAFESIAMTNLIKCTNVAPGDLSQDQTSYLMAECCILRLGVIWRELELLEPRTIVFYTHGLYRHTLDSLPIAVPGTIRELASQNYAVQCGKKRLRWWERECKTSWADRVRILTVGHPERMRRTDYGRLITDWVRS